MLRIAQVAIPTSNRGFCTGGNAALMDCHRRGNDKDTTQ